MKRETSRKLNSMIYVGDLCEDDIPELIRLAQGVIVDNIHHTTSAAAFADAVNKRLKEFEKATTQSDD